MLLLIFHLEDILEKISRGAHRKNVGVFPPCDFEGQPIRVVTDEHGEPWFVASDIAQ